MGIVFIISLWAIAKVIMDFQIAWFSATRWEIWESPIELQEAKIGDGTELGIEL